jgi:drug/metabolite transporter (DMT)-like permease
MENKNKPSSLQIWLGMLSIYIVWGSTYLAIRFAVESMPPFLMAGFRFLTAGAMLFLWRTLAGDPRPRRVEWRSAVVVGLFLLVGGNGSVVWAEQRVVSGVAALLVASAPLWMVILDAVGRGMHRSPAASLTASRLPGALTLVGVLVGFAGIVLLVGPKELTGISSGIDPVGAVVLSLGAFFWAAGSLYSRNASLPASPLLGTSMEMLAGGVGLFLLGTLSGEWGRLHLASIAPHSLWGLLYLIFFGSMVGFAAYTWLLRVAPTTLVSTYAYVNPLVAIFVGSVLAHEILTPRIMLATVVILGAVAVITLSQPARPKKEKESARSPVLTTGDD